MVSVRGNQTNNKVTASSSTSTNNKAEVKPISINNQVEATNNLAKYYSEVSQDWAVGEGLIQGIDYSSKTYALQAKESANEAKESMEITQGYMDNAISNIQTAETNALSNIVMQEESALSTVNQGIEQLNATITEGVETIETLQANSIAEITTNKESALSDITTAETNVLANIDTSKLNTLAQIEELANSSIEDINATGLDSKVSKSGDTMTGGLNFQKSNTLDFTNTNNTVYTEAGTIYFRDKNDEVCGQIRNYFNDYNNLATTIEARRSVNGTIKTSQIQIYVDKDGNNVVTAPSGIVPNSVVTTLACSRGGSGYYKLGNGLIIQWGSAVVPANKTDIVVTLPISFQYGYKVTANHIGSGGDPNQTNIMCAINSNSQFTLNNRSTNSAAMTRSWIAIGA